VGPARRISAVALAKVFLRLRQAALDQNRGHIVLPPSVIDVDYGTPHCPITDPHTTYWSDFFDRVHAAPAGSGPDPACDPPGLGTGYSNVQKLGALHGHSYDNYCFTDTFPDEECEGRNEDPIGTVAYSTLRLRNGVDWYRTTYRGSGPLPLDYLLTEFGPDWRIGQFEPEPGYDVDPEHLGVVWTGGFPNFLQGLSYWNTLLCYMTRRASFELNLEGWGNQNGHALYAMIHSPDHPPFVLDEQPVFPPPPDPEPRWGTRTQWYFNADAWATSIHFDADVYRCDTHDNLEYKVYNLDLPGHPGAYVNSFTRFTNPTDWGGKEWQFGPFGACYFVWAHAGFDPNVPTWDDPDNPGWFHDNGTVGSIGRRTVTIALGYNTIYIPFIKDYTQSPETWDGVKYNVKFVAGGSTAWHGGIDLGIIPHSTRYPEGFFDPWFGEGCSPEHTIYSAMVLPLTVYTSYTLASFEIELYRNKAGPRVLIGRPVVLLIHSCTWHSTM
ncbi:MAG: hypothetical protein ACRDIB_12990, partial [Ardenticatenaceae bacterium]